MHLVFLFRSLKGGDNDAEPQVFLVICQSLQDDNAPLLNHGSLEDYSEKVVMPFQKIAWLRVICPEKALVLPILCRHRALMVLA